MADKQAIDTEEMLRRLIRIETRLVILINALGYDKQIPVIPPHVPKEHKWPTLTLPPKDTP